MAENTENTTATTNDGEGKEEKASGVKNPTVESPKKDLPEAPKETQEDSKEVQDVTSIAEAVTGEDVQEIVSALLKRPEHVEDAFKCNPEAQFLYETTDEQVFLQKSDAENHSRFLSSKTVKTYER